MQQMQKQTWCFSQHLQRGNFLPVLPVLIVIPDRLYKIGQTNNEWI